MLQQLQTISLSRTLCTAKGQKESVCVLISKHILNVTWSCCWSSAYKLVSVAILSLLGEIKSKVIALGGVER